MTPTIFANDVGIEFIFVEFAAGAGGAVPSTLTRGNGLASASKTNTGEYTFQLAEPRWALLFATGEIRQATYDRTHASRVRQKTDNVNVPGAGSVTTPTVVLNTRTDDTNATAIDMTAGDVMQVMLVVQRFKP